MEIDITDFIANEDPSAYSASIAERGADAGKLTWRAALERAANPPRLIADNPDALDAWREDVRGFGAWEDEEIEAWSPEECEALFVQFVSGDMREGGISDDMNEADWKRYERRAENGECGGRLYRGDDGRIYFHIGS